MHRIDKKLDNQIIQDMWEKKQFVYNKQRKMLNNICKGYLQQNNAWWAYEKIMAR